MKKRIFLFLLLSVFASAQTAFGMKKKFEVDQDGSQEIDLSALWNGVHPGTDPEFWEDNIIAFFYHLGEKSDGKTLLHLMCTSKALHDIISQMPKPLNSYNSVGDKDEDIKRKLQDINHYIKFHYYQLQPSSINNFCEIIDQYEKKDLIIHITLVFRNIDYKDYTPILFDCNDIHHNTTKLSNTLKKCHNLTRITIDECSTYDTIRDILFNLQGLKILLLNECSNISKLLGKKESKNFTQHLKLKHLRIIHERDDKGIFIDKILEKFPNLQVFEMKDLASIFTSVCYSKAQPIKSYIAKKITPHKNIQQLTLIGPLFTIEDIQAFIKILKLKRFSFTIEHQDAKKTEQVVQQTTNCTFEFNLSDRGIEHRDIRCYWKKTIN